MLLLLAIMIAKTASAIAAGFVLASVAQAKPTVDTSAPYTGPKTPIGDWVNQDVNGNGKGYPRLSEPPAVKPATANPTNNINVISIAYAGADGVNIHYQTPFGLTEDPTVQWGSDANKLSNKATGASHT